MSEEFRGGSGKRTGVRALRPSQRLTNAAFCRRVVRYAAKNFVHPVLNFLPVGKLNRHRFERSNSRRSKAGEHGKTEAKTGSVKGDPDKSNVAGTEASGSADSETKYRG